MSGHENTKGNLGYLKKHYNQNKSMGEKAQAFEFKMTVKGYESWSVLCRSTQWPAMGRADVEDFGAAGLKFTQHGALENSGEMAITAVETVKGHMLRDLRKIVKNKEYVDITIELTPESTNGTPGEGQKITMNDCKLRSDAIDLSTEDTAALVKPSMTAVYNFLDL